jgi:hypothetical protein
VCVPLLPPHAPSTVTAANIAAKTARRRCPTEWSPLNPTRTWGPTVTDRLRNVNKACGDTPRLEQIAPGLCSLPTLVSRTCNT